MPNGLNNRMRYTRQSIVTNTFYQMPRFLMAGEFANNRISNNARILYVLLLDRHRVSVKNGWFDESGEVYIYFKREEMESQLGLSERTVSKVMQELKDLSLVEEKKQGLNKPNKIYLLSPIIGNDESPDPYLDPVPETEDDCSPESLQIPETQNLHPQTRKNYASGPVNSAVPDPQNLRPNHNKFNNNQVNDNEGSDTATAATANSGGSRASPTSQSVPYSQIQEAYNTLCESKGLRPIHEISDKRETQVAARFKKYGLSGFFSLFEKVSASIFLCGGGERGWKADFDWLIKPTNMQKVLEGKYDNDQSNIPAQQSQQLQRPSV